MRNLIFLILGAMRMVSAQTALPTEWIAAPRAEFRRKRMRKLSHRSLAGLMVVGLAMATAQNKQCTHSLEFCLTRPTEKGNPHGQTPVLWCVNALPRKWRPTTKLVLRLPRSLNFI